VAGRPTSRWNLEEFGGDERELTAAESLFLHTLLLGRPWLDVWLHADDDGTPWLIVSLDLPRKTLRVDFDGGMIAGGWSPASLNWDSGVRAAEAEVETASLDGISASSSDVVELAVLARAWFAASTSTSRSTCSSCSARSSRRRSGPPA
jgi:hypothetical protein